MKSQSSADRKKKLGSIQECKSTQVEIDGDSETEKQQTNKYQYVLLI